MRVERFLRGVMLLAVASGMLSAEAATTTLNRASYASDAAAGAALTTAANGANKGDTIIVGAGTWTLSQQIKPTKPITIRGATGKARDVVINGDGKTNCIFIPPNDGSQSGEYLVSGMTISNGTPISAGTSYDTDFSYDSIGGCIAALCSNATVSNCVITCVAAKDTGKRMRGIAALVQRATIVDCDIVNNRMMVTNVTAVGVAHQLALGLFAGTARNLRIANNELSGKLTKAVNQYLNVAVGFNCIGYSSEGNSLLDDCLIQNNFSTNYTGRGTLYDSIIGVNAYGDKITNCKIVGNSARLCGGVCFQSARAGSFEIANSEICNNLSWGTTGNAALTFCGSIEISDCLITNNLSNGAGNMADCGTALRIGANSTISNTWICSNYSKVGPAVYFNRPNSASASDYCKFVDCIISDNTYDGTTKTYSLFETDWSAGHVDFCNCVFARNSSGTYMFGNAMGKTIRVNIDGCSFVKETKGKLIYSSASAVVGYWDIRNSLFYNTASAANSYLDGFASANVISNCYYNGSSSHVYDNGTNLFTGDPKFNDYDNNDFSIKSKSVLRAMGTYSSWMGDGSKKGVQDMGTGTFEIERVGNYGVHLKKVNSKPRARAAAGGYEVEIGAFAIPSVSGFSVSIF